MSIFPTPAQPHLEWPARFLTRVRAVERRTVMIAALVMQGLTIATSVSELITMAGQHPGRAACAALASFSRPTVELLCAVLVLAILDYGLIRSGLARRGARTPETADLRDDRPREPASVQEFGRGSVGA